MTAYAHTLVIVCPVSKADDFQYLSSTWFQNFHIGGYEEPNFWNSGNPVVVKETVTTAEITGKLPQAPTRHPDDTSEQIDMGRAQSAKASMVLVTTEDLQEDGTLGNLPNPNSNKLMVFVDIPLQQVIRELDLTRTDPDAEAA